MNQVNSCNAQVSLYQDNSGVNIGLTSILSGDIADFANL